MGWPIGVVERVLAEPALDVVDQRAVLQRVRASRCHLHDRRRLRRAEGGDGDEGGDDEVDGNDVDDTFWHTGELAQQRRGRRRG